MDSSTFREWLAERGCRFDHFEHDERGAGHVVVTVHREGRQAKLPLGGSHKSIDAETARGVCEALDLDWSALPGPQGRA